MAHPLDGARLKFERSSEHIDTLHSEVVRFLETEAHRVRDKYDAHAGGYVREVDASSTPASWSLLLGEIAHNFRSCLDHIAWQLAVAKSPTGEPNDYWPNIRQISFPIFSDRREYGGEPNRKPERKPIWRLDGLLPHHARMIRRCQPYLRRHAPEAHPLRHLQELSNIDKHRVLHTTLVGLDETMPPPGHFFKREHDPATGEVEHVYDFSQGNAILPGAQMTVVARVGGPSEADMYFEGNLPFQVEIDEPGTILHEQPVLRLVNGIRTEVGAVLESFMPTL